MGLDKYNVNRGSCKEVGCSCKDYQRVKDGSRCICTHVATKHVTLGEDGSAWPTQSGRNWSSPYSQNVDLATCFSCRTQYSDSKYGSCLHCYPRERCRNSDCREFAYYDRILGSFNFCSPECRDKWELERANADLQKALKNFETEPNNWKGSSTTSHASTGTKPQGAFSGPGHVLKPTKEARGTFAVSTTTGGTPLLQLAPISCSTPQPYSDTKMVMTAQPKSHTTCTSESINSGKSVSDNKGRDKEFVMKNKSESSSKLPTPPCILPVDVPKYFLAPTIITFFDDAKLQDRHGKTGILVSAMSMEGEECNLRILDLVTHVGREAVKGMCGFDEKVDPTTKFTKKYTKVYQPSWTVVRKHNIPAMIDLGKFFLGDHKSVSRKHAYVAGMPCTTEDFVKEHDIVKDFLGIVMEDSDPKKIQHVFQGHQGQMIGLRDAYTIVSIAMFTSKGKCLGPDHQWNFDIIKSRAQENPDVCALLFFLEWD